MTTEQHIGQLDMDVQEIKKKLTDFYDILAEVNENIKTISTGLYGDEKNNHKGIISKYESLDAKIKELETKIVEIQTKNIEQDLLLKTKKNIWTQILEYIKWAGLIYLVTKGVFGVDSLFGGKFL